ncbi:MAG: hypothetical protein LBP75_08405 [Planctomycetota bacterium]|nr:hypothetical protein [Planctomycetota bacterium]
MCLQFHETTQSQFAKVANAICSASGNSPAPRSAVGQAVIANTPSPADSANLTR